MRRLEWDEKTWEVYNKQAYVLIWDILDEGDTTWEEESKKGRQTLDKKLTGIII